VLDVRAEGGAVPRAGSPYVTPACATRGALARPTARSASRFRVPSQSPTITRRFAGAVAVTAGENIDTAIVAAMPGVVCA